MGLTNIQSSGVGCGPCEFSANIRLRFEIGLEAQSIFGFATGPVMPTRRGLEKWGAGV